MDKYKIILCLTNILEIEEDELGDAIKFESMKFILFILEIEEMFGIEIEDVDLDLNKYTSLDSIYDTFSKYFI
ncbi:MAG: phosphopantetheine-binding protein [Defluviitaleaceae bacterium]|nr:phosphopantetheine-binding protein [Defluviitaleaceae bacterium]